ncbi:MAG: CDP-alcohol phosphatidyltransferase family protein [Candidatus Omnitrophica bacterium]|nr:CDP-alcohol phosphatidyltransferase family protein [Candidatus Omnitrophota bacterium]
MSLADKLSVLRIILIPVFVSLLIYSKNYPYLKYFAIATFILAVLSDFLDGLAARIKKEKSEIGQVIDPLADKLFLLTSCVVLYLLKFPIPLVFVLVVVSRDFIILLGIGVLHFMKIDAPINPTLWGKLTTFFQMLTILCILFEWPFSLWMVRIAILFTLISGLGYIHRGIIALNQEVARTRI